MKYKSSDLNISKVITFIVLMFTTNLFAEEITLLCDGTSTLFGSKITTYQRNYELTFDDKTKKVLSGIVGMSRGCFPTDDIDISESMCKCSVDDKKIKCESVGVELDHKEMVEDNFTISRMTGKLTGISVRKTYIKKVDIFTEYSDMSCKKIQKKF